MLAPPTNHDLPALHSVAYRPSDDIPGTQLRYVIKNGKVLFKNVIGMLMRGERRNEGRVGLQCCVSRIQTGFSELSPTSLHAFKCFFKSANKICFFACSRLLFQRVIILVLEKKRFLGFYMNLLMVPKPNGDVCPILDLR